MKKVCLFIVMAGIAFSGMAKKAYPGMLQRQMPDGSVVEYRLNGDENFRFTTLADGTLIKEGADGFFYYAQVTETGVKAMKTRVGAAIAPEKMAKASSAAVNDKLIALQKKAAARKSAVKQPSKTAMGSAKRGLAIMMEFPDLKFKYSQSVYNDMLNKEGFSDFNSTGSALDYFKSSSYGKYAPHFDVLGPYTAAHNAKYYGENIEVAVDYYDDAHATELILEACKLAAAAGNDLSIYDEDKDGYLDNVFVFYAGEGEANGGSDDTIWPHRFQVMTADEYGDDANVPGTLEDTKVSGVYVFDYACGNELCKANLSLIDNDFEGLGTFVHEFGHVLGLPDLYDTSGYSYQTLDVYDVMDHGDYMNMGRTPPAYSAYERMFCGWLTPKQIHPTKTGTQYILPAIDKGEVLLMTVSGAEHNMDGVNPNPGVFYLIENRSGLGWDKYMDPSGGANWLYNKPGDKGMLITKVSYVANDWKYNRVNAFGNSGVAYVYNTSQMYPYFYPMLPGKSNTTSVATGNFKFYDIANKTNGDIAVTISDRKGPDDAGVEEIAGNGMTATAAHGVIALAGHTYAEVFNAQGALIYSGAADNVAVNPGMYIVSMANEVSTAVKKVIVR